MATAEHVLNIARSQVGYYAPDDPEAGSKYGRWLAAKTGESWLAGPSVEIWWCCMYVSWCLDMAGQACRGFPSYNTDIVLGANPPKVPIEDMRPGDIVIWDWDGNSATDHIGFVESYVNGKLTTIEGNYRNSVARVDRTSTRHLISAVIRPPYGEESEQATEWDITKGIDLSNNDKGMRGDETRAGFVIVKASQGTTFRDAYAKGFLDSAANAGKLIGMYHFAMNGKAEIEAEWFVKRAKETGHLGEATLWLDYEAAAEKNGPAWAERFMKRVDKLTGKTCGFYARQGVLVEQDFFASAHRPLWVAQLPNEDPVYAWNDNPWTVGVFGAWGGTCAIHQYAWHGYVDGASDLDLNRGYFTRDQWAEWAGTEKPEPKPEPTSGIDVDGYWGKDTTTALQKALGVTVDGIIPHQWPTNAQPAFTTGWGYDRTGTGSETIKALQSKLGVHIDGLIGPHTIKALQTAMGTVADGELWEESPCIMEMQRRLNAGTF